MDNLSSTQLMSKILLYLTVIPVFIENFPTQNYELHSLRPILHAITTPTATIIAYSYTIPL